MIPKRLEEIVEDFESMEGREKVESLVDYSEGLSVLPAQAEHNHDGMEFVEECMTPVFCKAELVDGGMHFYFDIPSESPTVRGLAAILGEGLDGASPEEVLSVPNDFYLPMDLHRVLTMQRMNGFAAILAHMKRLATEALGKKSIAGKVVERRKKQPLGEVAFTLGDIFQHGDRGPQRFGHSPREEPGDRLSELYW